MRSLFRTFLLFLLLSSPTAFGAKFYVKPTGTGTGSSWVMAAGNLKQVIDNAQYGHEIWVAAGTYLPSSSGIQDSSFVLKNGVKLYGGFSGTETLLNQRDSTGATNLTVLSGELQGDTAYSNNSYGVVFGIKLDSNTVLDGFTITRGFANKQNFAIGTNGAGVFIVQGNPILKNLIISYNKAKFKGGGMYVIGSKVKMNRVKFLNNIADIDGGGLYCEESPSGTNWSGVLLPELRDIDFNSNYCTYSGGGAHIIEGSIKGSNINFNGNGSKYGPGAAYFGYDLSINIDRLTVTGNYCTDTAIGLSGGLSINGFGTLTNVLIANNTGTRAGGLILSQSNMRFVNATFANNKSNGNTIYDLANDVYLWGAYKTVFENCIFDSISNSIPTFSNNPVYSPRPVILKNCMLRGSLSALTTDSGGNTLLTNPGFVNPAAGNYHLAPCSPALNAGNNAFISGISTDLDNNPRIYANGTVDIGAYERQSSPGYAAILSSPKDTTVPAGSSATFSATGAGTTYQFQQSVNGGTTWNAISAPSSVGTITLSNVLLSMNGYQYRAIIKDPCGYADTSAVAKLFVTNSVFVNATNREESLISIYPNPATTQLHLKPSQKGVFTLYSLVGELQMSQTTAAGIAESIVNISSLPAGMYLWKFYAEAGTTEMGKLTLQE